MRTELLKILNRIDRPGKYPTSKDVEVFEEYNDYLFKLTDEYIFKHGEALKNHLINIFNEIVDREQALMKNLDINSQKLRDALLRLAELKKEHPERKLQIHSLEFQIEKLEENDILNELLNVLDDIKNSTLLTIAVYWPQKIQTPGFQFHYEKLPPYYRNKINMEAGSGRQDEEKRINDRMYQLANDGYFEIVNEHCKILLNEGERAPRREAYQLTEDEYFSYYNIPRFTSYQSFKSMQTRWNKKRKKPKQ